MVSVRLGYGLGCVLGCRLGYGLGYGLGCGLVQIVAVEFGEYRFNLSC